MGLVSRLLCVLLALFVVTPLFAQNMAVVDTRVLLMLHPNMVNFDYSNGRFFRDKVKYDDAEKLAEKLSQARKLAEANNQEVKKQIQDLQIQKFEVNRSLLREEQAFAPGDLQEIKKEKQDMETALKELMSTKPKTTDEAHIQDVKKAEFEERIQNLDLVLKSSADIKVRAEVVNKLKAQIKEIDIKIALHIDKMRKNNEQAVEIVYLTTEETEKKIESVKQEIKAIISSVAKAEQLGLVIDNSYALKSKINKEKNTLLPIVDENMDVVSASLFHSLINYETNKELEAVLDMPPDSTETVAQHLLAGRSDGLQEDLKQYMQYRNYLPEKVADFTQGNIFLSGGTNITTQCAEQIFAKYNVPSSLKQRYMNVLREHLGFYK